MQLQVLAQEWRAQASCKGSPLNFYGKRVRKEVMNLCSTCPAKEECYQYALRNEEYGYWGGSTETQRNKERHRLGIELPGSERSTSPEISAKRIKPITHGTESGYRSHTRNNIAFTDERGNECDCREAHKWYLRKYRESRAKSTEVA